MSTDSVLDALRFDIRLTDAPHDRTSYVPPWTTVIAPSLFLDATTTLAPSFGPLGTPARLTSGARLIHSPPVWADDTPSRLSLGAEPFPRRDLLRALVHASCRSTTWGDLAPPSLGRHPYCRVGVAATDAAAALPGAGDDSHDDLADQDLTADEFAGFVAELCDARAENGRLKDQNGRLQDQNGRLEDRVSMLTTMLDKAVVDTAYECYDCTGLRAELHSAQQSLASGAELLLRARNEKDQAEHELRLLRLRCLALEDSLNECNIALVAARASAATSSRLLHPSPRAAPFSGPVISASPSPPRQLHFSSLPSTSAPASALPVRAVHASPLSPTPAVGSQAFLSASDLSATVNATLLDTVVKCGAGVISRNALPGFSQHPRSIPWGVSGEPPQGAHVAMLPVLAVSKVPTLALKSSLTLQVWRPNAQFFLKQLKQARDLRDELDSYQLWSVPAAAATGTLRLLEGNGGIGLQARTALADTLARAQQPFSGLHRLHPLSLVLSESHPGTDLLYITYDVFTAIETLLFEILRRLCSSELQRAIFQRGARSAYSVFASLTQLPFDPQFDNTAYRLEVHSALSLKYATKHFPTFNAWLFQLCMLHAFFNTAFYNSEGCNAADFVDAVHNLLGTPPATRATLAQLFTRDAGNRIWLPDLNAEDAYFQRVAEFLPSLHVSGDGNVLPIGAVSAYGNQKSSRPGTSANAHGRQEPVSDVCPKCSRRNSDCLVCQYCLNCDHSEDDCPHIQVSAADASRPNDRYTCPRCKVSGDHFASHCQSLSKDLLKQRFRGKSRQDMFAMSKQSGGERSQKNRKQSLVTFGKLVDNEVVKSFRKAGKHATRDPAIRSRVVAHLLATMDGSASGPALENSATVTAAVTQADIDAEYIRSLERQFAKHAFEADQSRLSPRRARK